MNALNPETEIFRTEDFWRRFCRGEVTAGNTLISRISDAIKLACHKRGLSDPLRIDEAVQETLLAVWRSFCPVGSIKLDNPSGWIWTVADRFVLKQKTRHASRNVSLIRDDGSLIDPPDHRANTASDFVPNSESFQKFQEHIPYCLFSEQISSVERRAIIQKDFTPENLGLSLKEVADKYGIAYSTFRERYERGKEKFIRCLREKPI